MIIDYLYSFFYYKQKCCYCDKILYIKYNEYDSKTIPSCSFNCSLNYIASEKNKDEKNKNKKDEESEKF